MNKFTPKLLIVDDMSSNVLVLKEILKELNAEIITATSGKEAVELIVEHEFALLLLDVEMPEMDGFEVAQHIRDNKYKRTLPIIFVTGKLLDDDFISKGYQSGAVDYLLKPINPYIVQSKVQVFLDLAQQKFVIDQNAVNLEKLIDQRTAELSDAKQIIEQALTDTQGREKIILENMVDGLITIDTSGSIISLNNAACEIFGYSKEELLLKNSTLLMPEPFHSEQEQFVKNYIQNGIKSGIKNIIGQDIEAEGLRKNGDLFPLKLAIAESTSKGKQIFSSIVRDISESRRMEKMKDEFISTVSHELRTPLTSIRGSLGLLVGGVIVDIPEKAQQMISIAYNNSERLLLLINDILDIQKIESGELGFKFEKIALKPLLEKAIVENKSYADQYQVSLNLDILGSIENIEINADPNRLMQVLNNLLSNAAKFSNQGGEVKLILGYYKDLVRITVIDEGMGIPDEFKAKLFDKFTQSDSSDTRQKGGTGLGLSISRLIVEKHGGELSFMSRIGKGSRFFIDLYP